MNYDAVRAALKEQGGARPKRVFVVYSQSIALGRGFNGGMVPGSMSHVWRWRLVATTNWSIVGGSQESFDSRGNAIRAAKREASHYKYASVVMV
jgi:hypothetical protein